MNDEWQTPGDLFDKLDEEFGFTVDLCTDGKNSKCDYGVLDIEAFVTGSLDKIGDVYWMNPPYSRPKIRMCMEQAYELSCRGHTVVCLVRDDPSAKWYQDLVDDEAVEVRRLKHRVKFKGADSAYNFPCCLVIYDGDVQEGYNSPCGTEYQIWSWRD